MLVLRMGKSLLQDFEETLEIVLALKGQHDPFLLSSLVTHVWTSRLSFALCFPA